MDTNKQDLIDRFIRKELSEEEESNFKKTLIEDQEASENIELLEHTRRRLGARAMKDKLISWGFTEEKFQKEETTQSNKQIKLWVGLSAAACLVLIFMFNVPDNNSATDQLDNYNPPSFESPTVTDSLQSQPEITDSITPSKNELIDSLQSIMKNL